MIRFADRHALRVALAALPDDAWGRPARWSVGPDGVAVAGDAAAMAALAPWGEPVDARAAKEASCWAEVFGLDPLPAADAPVEVLLQVPVDRLVEIAGELLRLGASDLRWGATPTDGWIRARHPPRWTLERDDLVVYGRQGALWVRWGWRCPLAEAAFHPVASVVDYLLDRDGDAVRAWMQSATFDWDAVVGAADRPTVAAPARGDRPAPTGPPPEAPAADPDPPAPAPPPRAVAPVAPVALPSRSADLQADAFLADPRPWDDAGRAAGWWALGDAADARDDARDAGLCWTRAVWLDGDVAGWWARASRRHPDPLAAIRGPPPDAEAVRAVCAALAAGVIPPLWLSEVQRWLDQHDGRADLRARWLAGRALADATDDPLRLAEAGDRVLGALRWGLPVAGQVPTAVRRVGTGAAAHRQLTALDALHARFRATRRTRSVVEAPEALTLAYVDLVFAAAYARLGRDTQAEALIAGATAALPQDDPVHGWALSAFCARIAGALGAEPPDAPLPPALHDALEALPRFQRYKLDRIRESTWVLAPTERLDPLHAFAEAARGAPPDRGTALLDAWASGGTPAAQAAAAADAARDPLARAALLGRIHTLSPGAATALLDALANAPGADADAIGRGRDALAAAAAVPAPDRAAADAASLARAVARSPKAAEAPAAIDAAVHALRRLRLDAPLRAFLEEMPAEAPLAVRLAVASGWFAARQPDRATPVLEQAFAALDGPLVPADRTALIRAIARAAARAEATLALAAAERLADQLARTTDSYNTNSHCCVSVLALADGLAAAVTSEDVGLGPDGRRWLDIDEAVLRAGVHRDLAARRR